jgi:PAS domain S-box-containing protein
MDRMGGSVEHGSSGSASRRSLVAALDHLELTRRAEVLEGAPELGSLLDQALTGALSLSGAALGNIQLLDPLTRSLKIVAQRGFGTDFLNYFAVVDDPGSACGRAAKQATQAVIANVNLDEGFSPHREIAAASGFQAVVSTPILDRSGAMLGVVSTHFQRAHRPATADLRLIEHYGHEIGDAITRHVGMRVAHEFAARELGMVTSAPDGAGSDHDLGRLVETMTDPAIVVLDREGLVRAWGVGPQRIHGYRSDEILGNSFSRFYPPEHAGQGRPQRDLDRAITAGRYQRDGWRMRKDGSRFWANIVILPVLTLSGAVRGFAEIIRDLTHQRGPHGVTRVGGHERSAAAGQDSSIGLLHYAGMELQALTGSSDNGGQGNHSQRQSGFTRPTNGNTHSNGSTH